MRKIVIANQKGGVAKTTTAVNLATGLALKGRRALLVDTDPQADSTYAVLGDEKIDPSTYDLLIRNLPTKEVIRQTKEPNLDIIPSDIDLAGAEVELISRVGGQTRLRTKLSELKEHEYHYIVIDAPPSLGFLTINALAAAEEVFIPVSASVFALNGIGMLEETIEQVKTELNSPKLRISGVLCTFFDHTNVAKDIIAEIRDHFGNIVFNTIIPKNVKLEEAHSRTESVYVYAPKSTGAQAYRELVDEVISHE